MIPLPHGTQIFLRPERTDGRCGIHSLSQLVQGVLEENLFFREPVSASEQTGEYPQSPVRGPKRLLSLAETTSREGPEQVIDMDELEKTCGCGATWVKLEIIPAQFFVCRAFQPRYACPQCGSFAAGIYKGRQSR
jgi:hypothetical protein